MLYIGPHVSIAKDISLAPERAHELGATGFAIFTKNQRVWRAAPLSEESIASFRNTIMKYGYTPRSILPHAGYLINPASPYKELWEKSLGLFLDEAARTVSLSLDTINIHPGAYKEGSKEEGIKRSAAMMDEVLDRTPGLRIAIENTAGAGTILGSSFEELDALLSAAKEKDRIGFTLDTAHLFGSGYDVASDPDGVLDAFASRFGSGKLYGMHLNDSKVPLGSHKDRHESIGKGLIGRDAFLAIVKRTDVQNIPLVLETIDESLWKEEVSLLLSAGSDS